MRGYHIRLGTQRHEILGRPEARTLAAASGRRGPGGAATLRSVITSQRLGQAPSDLLQARLGGRRVRVVHRHLGKVVGQPVHELPAHVRRQMLPALGAAIFEQRAGVAIQVAEHRRPRGQERGQCVRGGGGYGSGSAVAWTTTGNAGAPQTDIDSPVRPDHMHQAGGRSARRLEKTGKADEHCSECSAAFRAWLRAPPTCRPFADGETRGARPPR